ncbi:hypothetical protein KIW84_045564 [Lathyrus oleraceus]|uniref:Gag-pro-like protein n=1 Tax=Pisum sativum TaxID=3888 RepID=A0A9D4XKQ3_PEA|nr:hypothetical protein KIW84_045564 [Pisum sativum]
MSYQLFLYASAKLTHRYNTRANQPSIMDHLEQENRELKDEISQLTAMMESVLAAQSQSSPTPTTPPQMTVISEVATLTIPVAATQSGPSMPVEFPSRMPPNFMPEGFTPTFGSMSAFSSVMSVPPLVVHILPRVEDIIYHSEPSEGPDVHEKMEEMKDQFLELRKELKTLRGNDLFGKSAAELCLVPNVKILMKFKVPDFEKYKGNTCPLSHLVMYARKMSTQNDNDQLLITTFKKRPAEVYVSKGQRDIQRVCPEVRELAAQINPALEEKEMTKIFLKTLSSFYYERMIASTPNDFSEMVNMGMRLEEGVREGRLSKEEVSSSRKYGSGFAKKKEGEANVVSVERKRRPHVRRNPQPRQHQHQVSSVIPVFSNNSNNQSVSIQQQRQQQPQQRTNYNNNNNQQ